MKREGASLPASCSQITLGFVYVLGLVFVTPDFWLSAWMIKAGAVTMFLCAVGHLGNPDT